MDISIPFQKGIIQFQVKEENLAEVLTPHLASPIDDLLQDIQKSLDNPLGQPALREWIPPDSEVLILCDDNTRLTPTDKLLQPLILTLNEAGIDDDQISILIALGTHRPMTEVEVTNKVGTEVSRRIRVQNHSWDDPDQLMSVGLSKSGTPVHVNKAALAADIIIGLGSIVPHHIAGFSGSSKIIQPGICGAATTTETHLAATRGQDSLLGVENNAVRRDMDDIADRVGLRTILNVVLNHEGLVAGVFGGEMREVYAKGVDLAKKVYGVPYHEAPEIVVASSCPCDIDFWQAHKSLYPSARIVKRGGTIIVVTPAPEGVSSTHSSLLNFASWPSGKIEKVCREGKIEDGVAAALAVGWARVREKASVIMVSPGISPEEKKSLGFTHADNLEDALAVAFQQQGAKARLTVLTHAPEILPLRAY